MDFDAQSTVARSQQSILETNKVLRNTYSLLAMTLVFSALTAGVSMAMNFPHLGWLSLIGYIGLFFLTYATRNSVWGLVSVFALTGFMGLTLGPLLSAVLSIPNGGQMVMQAMGGTGIIFFALSAYVLKSQKDFSFMGGFLFAGLIVVVLAVIASLFIQVPGLQLALSAAIILLMSGYILFDTSRIIHGGETNYIMATVGLYVNIYNIFVNLLHIIMAFSGDD